MTPAKPQHGTGHTPAPSSLTPGDEWIEVEANGDYVGEVSENLMFTDVRVRGGRWSGVTIEGLTATDVRFENCDLAGFVLQDDVSLRRVEFVGCRMTGAVLAGAHLRDVIFDRCALDDANLRMTEARDVAFHECSLVGADFYAAKLAKLDVRNSDLRGADFTKATLGAVDLRTSRVEDVRGADALRGATVDSLQVLALARSLAIALGINVVDEDDASSD